MPAADVLARCRAWGELTRRGAGAPSRDRRPRRLRRHWLGVALRGHIASRDVGSSWQRPQGAL